MTSTVVPTASAFSGSKPYDDKTLKLTFCVYVNEQWLSPHFDVSTNSRYMRRSRRRLSPLFTSLVHAVEVSRPFLFRRSAASNDDLTLWSFPTTSALCGRKPNVDQTDELTIPCFSPIHRLESCILKSNYWPDIRSRCRNEDRAWFSDIPAPILHQQHATSSTFRRGSRRIDGQPPQRQFP